MTSRQWWNAIPGISILASAEDDSITVNKHGRQHKTGVLYPKPPHFLFSPCPFRFAAVRPPPPRPNDFPHPLSPLRSRLTPSGSVGASYPATSIFMRSLCCHDDPPRFCLFLKEMISCCLSSDIYSIGDGRRSMVSNDRLVVTIVSVGKKITPMFRKGFSVCPTCELSRGLSGGGFSRGKYRTLSPRLEGMIVGSLAKQRQIRCWVTPETASLPSPTCRTCCKYSWQRPRGIRCKRNIVSEANSWSCDVQG